MRKQRVLDVPDLEALGELITFSAAAVEQRRREPRDDVLTTIAEELARGSLPEPAAVGLAVALLSAGHQPTIKQLGITVTVLADRPDIWDALGTGELEPAGVIEAVLRFRSTNQAAIRRVAQSFEYQGVCFEAGDPILVNLAAANRDPSRFSEPERLDLDPSRTPHVSFGFGPHHCLGASLARGAAPGGPRRSQPAAHRPRGSGTRRGRRPRTRRPDLAQDLVREPRRPLAVVTSASDAPAAERGHCPWSSSCSTWHASCRVRSGRCRRTSSAVSGSTTTRSSSWTTARPSRVPASVVRRLRGAPPRREDLARAAITRGRGQRRIADRRGRAHRSPHRRRVTRISRVARDRSASGADRAAADHRDARVAPGRPSAHACV